MTIRSWASLTDEDDNINEKESAPIMPPANKIPDQPCEQLEEEACGGWQEVMHRRSPRCLASASAALPPRPIPAWLSGRCCRCLAFGHRAAVCRDPLRCFRCLENGHHGRDCRNPWRPLSSLPCLAMRPVSRHDIEHHHGLASCVSLLGSTPPSKALRSRSWASIVSAPAASVPPSDVVL
jgi:hypothetical protein